MIFCLIINFLLLTFGDGRQLPIVNLNNQGSIQGVTLKSYDGRSFDAFRGIPYAKATSGALRFKPPQPLEPSDVTINATMGGHGCPQIDKLRGFTGSEDCLNLNVYTPNIDRFGLLPVLFFIHGGGFTMGTGAYAMYGPEKFMDYDIVVVTINYRLGVLGFLNSLDDNAVGNFGLLDQVSALQWVQNNIKSFGGDPNSVTIMGHSAGSASVIYHMLSPLSSGLFHRAIAQSASPYVSKSAYQPNPLNWAKKIANNIDCPYNTNENLIECFRQKSVKELIEGSHKLLITDNLPSYCAPSRQITEGGFIFENPSVLIKEGKFVNKVPIIIGITAHEFYAFYQQLFVICKGNGKQWVDETLPKCLQHFVYNITSDMTDVFKLIYQEYFQNLNLDDLEVFENAVVQTMSDLAFSSGISKTVEYLSSFGIPTYAYNIPYMGSHSLAVLFGGKRGKYTSHGDELFLQFNFLSPLFKKMSEDDLKVSKLINFLWTSFASDKELEIEGAENNFKWEKYDINNPKYLEINVKPKMKEGVLCPKMNFWGETIPKLIENIKNKKDEL